MASFDDDADPAGGSNDEFDNEDEEMEDVNDGDGDADQDQGQYDDGGDEDDDEDNDDNEGDNEEDEDEDQNDADSPSRRASERVSTQRSADDDGQRKPDVVLTSPSPRTSAVRSPPGTGPSSFIPPTRPEALTAQAYDIVPTIAAPQSTSINAICATPDMRWVFSGGSDGYVRMFNWVETANGKVPLTVAQKHPFVDSVMKAGSLITYWENEEALTRTPPTQPDEGKWTSPVHALAVQHQALWLLSGLESGGINLQTCRHQAGTRITTLKEHTSAVSVLQLSRDETSLLSGSWDKMMYDWDLQTGKVKRSFKGSSVQISAVETRPMSDVPIPELAETIHESLGTFSSNNADKPLTNGVMPNGSNRRESRIGEEDAMGSPSESLFGEGDHGSLFGEDAGAVGGSNTFGDDEDELTRALADGLQEDAREEQDAGLGGEGSGGPVQPPDTGAEVSMVDDSSELPNGEAETQATTDHQSLDENTSADTVMNNHPHSDEPLTAPPTGESSKVSAADLTPQSESTFLNAAIDGTVRIWDRRMSSAIACIQPYGGVPPWCISACWSPDGNFIYAGRRNCTVDEYSIHKLGSSRGKPERTFRFQQGSGPVYAVKSMPNGRHLVW